MASIPILTAPRANAPVFDPRNPGVFSSYWMRWLNAVFAAISGSSSDDAMLLALLGAGNSRQVIEGSPSQDAADAQALASLGIFAPAPNAFQPAISRWLLTVPTTNITPPVTNANLLIVIVQQDATGGRAITWDTAHSHFIATDTNLGQALPNTFSVFLFALSQGKWVMVSEGPKDMAQ